MATLSIVNRKIDELVPYARNARKHPAPQIKQLEGGVHPAPLRKYTLTTPFLDRFRQVSGSFSL